MEIRTIEDDLRAVGATKTDLGNFLVPCASFDVLIRFETRNHTKRIVLYVPIACASERDVERCLESGAELLVGVPIVCAGSLLVRCMLSFEHATRPVLWSTITALANDATRFEIATRPARPAPAAYACLAL